jgi:hypothetical protein
MEIIEGTICPICGWDQEEEIYRLMGHICDCCGTQFAGIYFVREDAVKERQRWIDTGYPWFRPRRRPKGWDPEEQFNQMPAKYR